MSAGLFIDGIFKKIEENQNIQIGPYKLLLTNILDTHIVLVLYTNNNTRSILSVTSIHKEITSRRTDIIDLKKINETLLAQSAMEENDEKVQEIMDTIRDNTLLIRNHTSILNKMLVSDIKIETDITSTLYKILLGVSYVNFMSVGVNVTYVRTNIPVETLTSTHISDIKIKFEQINTEMIHNFMWNLCHDDNKKYLDSILYWNSQSNNPDLYYMVPRDKKKDIKKQDTELSLHHFIGKKLSQIDKKKGNTYLIIKEIKDRLQIKPEILNMIREIYITYIFTNKEADIVISENDLIYGTSTNAELYSFYMARRMMILIKQIRELIKTTPYRIRGI